MDKNFLACERGAVTADWIALGAGVVLLALVTVYAAMAVPFGVLLDSLERVGAAYGTGAGGRAAGASPIPINRPDLPTLALPAAAGDQAERPAWSVGTSSAAKP